MRRVFYMSYIGLSQLKADIYGKVLGNGEQIYTRGFLTHVLGELGLE